MNQSYFCLSWCSAVWKLELPSCYWVTERYFISETRIIFMETRSLITRFSRNMLRSMLLLLLLLLLLLFLLLLWLCGCCCCCCCCSCCRRCWWCWRCICSYCWHNSEQFCVVIWRITHTCHLSFSIVFYCRNDHKFIVPPIKIWTKHGVSQA